MFTYALLPRLAYSRRRTNVQLSEKMVHAPALAVVAAVSREVGLVAWHICDRSINSETFIEFIGKVALATPCQNAVLFLDNCRVHHSKKVKGHLKDVDLTTIFNVPYSPQYNPIERVWAMVKMQYKKMKLRALQGGVKIDYR